MVADVMTDSRIARLGAALREQSDVRLALLFGSGARGELRADSDLDVAVIAPGVDLFALGATLTLAAGVDVDVVRLDDETPIPLLGEIVRDGVPLHEASPGAYATFRSHALSQLELDEPWYARQRDAFLGRLAAGS